MAEASQETFLKGQLEKERASHAKACKEWREREMVLQTEMARACDLAAAEAHRADLAEGRIGQLRGLLERGNNDGSPAHPLYLRGDLTPRPFTDAEAFRG